MQSPHSPLHMHMPIQASNRLSARYINNKPSTKANSLLNNGAPTNKAEAIALTSSKLLCSCEKTDSVAEKTPPSSGDSIKSTQRELSSKRVVSMRNAATSPNLDLRRIDNKIIYSNGGKHLREQAIETLHDTNKGKLSLEKSNSLTDAKPQRMLRTTRSLSPRPPVRHQKAIWAEDEQEVGIMPPAVYANRLSSSSLHYMQAMGNCRSEQTSPNNSDLSNKMFLYNDKTNRSTDCLPKVPTDPWLRMNETVSKHLGGSLTNNNHNNNNNTYKKETQSKMATAAHNIDPWVKRTDALSKQLQQFRQTKSLTGTRLESEIAAAAASKSKRPPVLQRSKSPTIKHEFSLPAFQPLQSAPSSPNFLSVNNSFSLGFPLGGSQEISPTKGKQHSAHGFKDVSTPSSPRQKSAHLNGSSKRTYLNIEPSAEMRPHLLQARHSFTSLCSQQQQQQQSDGTLDVGHNNELQLNIRRLSEQMRKGQKAQNVGNEGNVQQQLSSSDRNVNQPINVSIIQLNSGGADFSEYLNQQFQYRGFKTSTSKLLNSCETVNGSALQAKVHDDTLLETTC